jgi:hypothetical protein
MSHAPLLELAERRRWWRENGTSERFDCPCCGYPTLGTRGGYEICRICWWEDDGQDDHNADMILGFSNSDYSLTEGRLNFANHLCHYRLSDTRIIDSGLLEEQLMILKKNLISLYEEFILKNQFNEAEFSAQIRKLERLYFKK